MEQKRQCFDAGAKLFWQVAPENQTADAYTSLEQKTEAPADRVLDGRNVLPGFRFSSLKKLLKRAGQWQGKRSNWNCFMIHRECIVCVPAKKTSAGYALRYKN